MNALRSLHPRRGVSGAFWKITKQIVAEAVVEGGEKALMETEV